MLRHSLTQPANTLLSCPLAPSPFLSTPPKTPYVTPLSATLTNSFASVASKRLTPKLTPLDATLTKNTRGEGECPSPNRRRFFSSLATRHSLAPTRSGPLPPEKLTPSFSHSSTLFCTFLHLAKSQLLSFHANPHSCAKTPRVGYPPKFPPSLFPSSQLSTVSCQLYSPRPSQLPYPDQAGAASPRITEHVSLPARHSPLVYPDSVGATSLLNSCPSLTRSHHV
jgi:hypothetical protein